MARRRSLSSFLFRAARRVDDVEAIASANPKRIERRVKNRLIGSTAKSSRFLAEALALTSAKTTR